MLLILLLMPLAHEQIEAHQKDMISGKFQPDIHVRLGRRDDPLLLVYARQFLEHFGYEITLRVPVLCCLLTCSLLTSVCLCLCLLCEELRVGCPCSRPSG